VTVVSRPRPLRLPAAFARVVLGAMLLAGCVSTSAEPGFRDVASTVHERTGHRLRWDQATAEDDQARRAVRSLLERPLSVDSAVEVALLNDPSLQALYEELSVAQADVVQAGLLSNPVFSIGMTTAERENLDPNLVAGITQSFLDLVLLPARKHIAASQFDAVKFRVGSAVLDAASRVAVAFFTVEGAAQALAVTRTIAEAENAALELTQRQAEAGNVGDLSVAAEKTLALQAHLDVMKAEAELTAAREQLTRRLGLRDASWSSSGRLPDIPAQEPGLDQLVDRAVHERLDMTAVRQEVQTLESALSLARASRWTGIIDLGADVARLKDGTVVVGPRASIELPIFDQRQAAIARIEAQLRMSRQLLAAREVEVRSEVRAARDRLDQARRIAELYRTSIIPAREQTVALSQQQYDAMLLGVYPLIAAKQSEGNAYREYVMTVRDYWIARADLERAAGGRTLAAPSAAAHGDPLP
jgi:outer membrane protein, heavy metal efflux system